MFKSLLKIATRGLLKNKGFTFINIFGLSLGLIACLFILFYVFDELSYDRYNTKIDRIFRVNTDLKAGGSTSLFAVVAPPTGEAIAREFPEVESSVRITPAIDVRFKKGNEIEKEDGKAVYCDANIFDIFTLPILFGDPKNALKEPNSMVISESAALKYFNQTDVVGKVLFMVSDSSSYKINGVMKNMPQQSHFNADFLMTLQKPKDNWMMFVFNTYILLRPGADYKNLENKFDSFIRKHMNTGSFNYDQFASKGNFIKLSLTPLKDIHLKSNRQRELAANGDIQYVYIFSAIAVFVLVLACVNFINLSTARSANRAREVGVRKVLGSPRTYLMAQFLFESIVITLIATIIAVLSAWALLPLFNQLSGKDLTITLHVFLWLVPCLFVIIIVVGLIAGAYPAFFLSAFQPINVLKGKLSTGLKGGALRNVLVIFQFSMSVFLIIGTLVVYGQLSYIKNKDIGFNRSQVLIVKNANSASNPLILKQEVKQLPGVFDATLSSFLPTGDRRAPGQFDSWTGQSIQGEFWTVDENYLNTMGIKLIEGRNFSSQFPTDSLAMIINETAAKKLGYTGNPLELINKKYHIIGVVKDFNFSSLRDNVTPLVMVLTNDYWRASLSVKVSTNNLPELMNRIESLWKKMAPGQQFEFSFMDDDFNAIYDKEQRMGGLFFTFTTIAIVIACLGLLGLAAYAAEQRNKEIGIRKVLGASVTSIVTMFSKSFLKLVLFSILIATPIVWLVMHNWLEGFAYRQNIKWYIFILTDLGVILVALVTVVLQSVKAAIINPLKSLRND